MYETTNTGKAKKQSNLTMTLNIYKQTSELCFCYLMISVALDVQWLEFHLVVQSPESSDFLLIMQQ